MSRMLVIVMLASVTGIQAGCGLEDYAGEEGFLPKPGYEARAEALFERFVDRIDDEEYGNACALMTRNLRARLALRFGSCRRVVAAIADAGGLSEVVDVRDSRHGLWMETYDGSELLMRGDRIARLQE
jgi:hypothetical protein